MGLPPMMQQQLSIQAPCFSLPGDFGQGSSLNDGLVIGPLVTRKTILHGC